MEDTTIDAGATEPLNMTCRGAYIAHMKRYIEDPGAHLNEVSDAWHEANGLPANYYHWDHTQEVAPDVSAYEAEYDRLRAESATGVETPAEGIPHTPRTFLIGGKLVNTSNDFEQIGEERYEPLTEEEVATQVAAGTEYGLMPEAGVKGSEIVGDPPEGGGGS